jgi:hypothetical protein
MNIKKKYTGISFKDAIDRTYLVKDRCGGSIGGYTAFPQSLIGIRFKILPIVDIDWELEVTKFLEGIDTTNWTHRENAKFWALNENVLIKKIYDLEKSVFTYDEMLSQLRTWIKFN